MDNSLKLIHCNIRSLNQNICKIESDDVFLKSDIIILTEAWIQTGSFIPNINGFDSVVCYSCSNISGGVACYIKKGITYKEKILQLKELAVECVILQLDHLNLNIICLYRHPNNNYIGGFCDMLQNMMSNIYQDKKNFQNIIIKDNHDRHTCIFKEVIKL